MSREQQVSRAFVALAGTAAEDFTGPCMECYRRNRPVDVSRPEEVLTRLQTALAFKATLEIAKGMIAEAGGLSFVDAARALRDYTTRDGARLTATVDALVCSELPPARVLARTQSEQTG